MKKSNIEKSNMKLVYKKDNTDIYSCICKDMKELMNNLAVSVYNDDKRVAYKVIKQHRLRTELKKLVSNLGLSKEEFESLYKQLENEKLPIIKVGVNIREIIKEIYNKGLQCEGLTEDSEKYAKMFVSDFYSIFKNSGWTEKEATDSKNEFIKVGMIKSIKRAHIFSDEDNNLGYMKLNLELFKIEAEL